MMFWKRTLSWLLCMSLALSLLPAQAFAGEEPQSGDAVIAPTAAATDVMLAANIRLHFRDMQEFVVNMEVEPGAPTGMPE